MTKGHDEGTASLLGAWRPGWRNHNEKRPVLVSFRQHAAAFAILCSLLGCQSSAPLVVDNPIPPIQDHLIRLGIAYARFIADKSVPPKGPGDVQPYLEKLGNPEELLRSPRDNQPLTICWGVDISKPAAWAKSTPVIAYEKNGVDGKRVCLDGDAKRRSPVGRRTPRSQFSAGA